MSEIQTYKNWKAVTEADFVSLFIKTWFAYISTLRVMFPEAQNTRGDGKYLYAYNKFYLQEGRKKFIVDDTIMGHIDEHTTYASRQLTKIQSLEKRALSIIWSIFTLNAKDDSNKTYDEMIRSRNSYEVIRQNPLNYFEYHMEVDLQPNRVLTASEESWYKKLYETRNQNSVIWFLSFVYRLRNALFHEIIDPLNEEWQLIFKNAYLVLKEIVDLNISEIGKTAIAENSVV